LYLYKQVGENWRDVSLAPDSLPSNLFGLNRRARAQGVEAGLLQANLQGPSEWAICGDSVFSCLARQHITMTIRNVSPNPTLCGEIAFVRQPPLPWAWRSFNNSMRMPARIVELRSQC
jgi:antimicrobial peptide system SdpA family protein